jgi:hypothetical protein
MGQKKWDIPFLFINIIKCRSTTEQYQVILLSAHA